MNGILINVDQMAFHIEASHVHWYSLAIILAVVAAVVKTAHRARKKAIITAHIYSLALWVMLGGIVGTRLIK